MLPREEGSGQSKPAKKVLGAPKTPKAEPKKRSPEDAKRIRDTLTKASKDYQKIPKGFGGQPPSMRVPPPRKSEGDEEMLTLKWRNARAVEDAKRPKPTLKLKPNKKLPPAIKREIFPRVYGGIRIKPFAPKGEI